MLWVLLLAVCALPAHAQYAEQTGSDNPFDGITATSTAAALDAVAGDFDTDGDVDLLAYDGTTERFFANDGSGSFTEQAGSANPFDGVSRVFATRGRTFVRDVDADGDLDLVTFDYTGGGTGALVLVENTDGSTYARQTGPDNPFDGLPVSGNHATVDAVMGNFSGDDAPDLLVYDGSTERYYENDGSGSFAEQTGSANPFDGLSQAFGTKVTTLVRDFDGDGDTDLAFRDGTGDATAWQYRENTSSGFVARTGTDNPLADVAADATASSVAAVTGDFDLDGALDLLTYDDGTQRYYDGDGTGTFTEETDNAQLFDGERADPALQVQATTVVRDIEPDDDPDLLRADAQNDALRFVERQNTDLTLTDGSASGLDFAGRVSPGTDDNPVGLFALSADQSGASFDGVTVTNVNAGVSGIRAARLYWSSDRTLQPSSDTILDAVSTDASNAPSSIVFDGFKQSIPTSAHHVILAIDVQAGASGEVQFELETDSDLQTPGAEIATVNGNNQSAFSSLPLSNETTALPVEMATFEGGTTEDGVRLNWRTASEQNNAGFRVERRARGRGSEESWTKVGFVDGSGTTSEVQRYRFTDEDLPYAADTLRYRLRQVDTDGTTSLTDPVIVARGGPDGLELLGTAPNPARQRATVRYGVPEPVEGKVRLRLYDVMGRQVQSVATRAEAGRHEQTLDVGDLSSGVYVLRLTAGGQAKTRKLTVVR